MDTTATIAPDIAVDRVDTTKLGRRWTNKANTATVIEVVDAGGKDTGERIIVNDPGRTTADRYSVVHVDGEQAENAAVAVLGKDYATKLRARPTPAVEDAVAAIRASRDRVDHARRGMVRDDLADAGDWMRVAAAHVKDDDGVLRKLTAADRAISDGDVERASVALDAAAGTAGRDQERAGVIAIEAVHGTRSRDEWQAKLAARDYGLVPDHEGNKTSWKLEDRKTGQSWALADAGFTGEVEPAKIEAAWQSGMAVDVRKTLIERDLLSTRKPEQAKPLGPEVSDRARRADDIRHGQDRALESALAALPPEKLRSVVQAKAHLLADRARSGDNNTRVTAEQLDARLKQDGVTFGAETTPDGEVRAIGFAEALSRAAPAPETKAHMQKWLSGSVWSVQNQMLSEGKTPTWPAYQEALADRGIDVSRTYDGDSKTYNYRYGTTMPGLGRFEHSEQELGFDATKDPRLSTHALVESADAAAFRAKARNALSDAVKQAGNAGISKLWTNERDRVNDALADQGLQVRIMEQEFLGRKRDGTAVFGLRIGIEDQETGRIAPISELGFAGTEHATLGAKVHMLGGPVEVEKMSPKEAFDQFTDGFKEALSGFGSALGSALQGGNINMNAGQIDIWKSTKKPGDAAEEKPLRRPSWERGQSGDTQSSSTPPRDRLPSM